MKVIICEPFKLARVADIKNDLDEFYKLIDCDYVETVYPFKDDVCIICDDEGKLKRKEFSRPLRSDGVIYDIIAGTFIITGINEDDFCSLTDSQLETYLEMFKYPEEMMVIDGQIVGLKLTEDILSIINS